MLVKDALIVQSLWCFLKARQFMYRSGMSRSKRQLKQMDKRHVAFLNVHRHILVRSIAGMSNAALPNMHGESKHLTLAFVLASVAILETNQVLLALRVC